MPGKAFDPEKFIDREFEQELFEELLQRKDEARILAIRDGGEMGKSHLLRQFQYRCRTVKPRTPVSLVALDQLSDASPLALVQQIARDLSALVEFSTFDRYEDARRAYDFTTIRGSVDLQGANLERARVEVGGVIAKFERAGPVILPPASSEWTPEQQSAAQEKCVLAFFEDLKAFCDRGTAVLMLDAYERCDPNLQNWLLDCFLERYYFSPNHRPRHLLLVIAGRESPDFRHHWPADDCQKLVKSVKALTKWTRASVEKCLRVHGYAYNPEDVNTFHRWVESGLSPAQVVGMIQTLVGARGASQ